MVSAPETAVSYSFPHLHLQDAELLVVGISHKVWKA